ILMPAFNEKRLGVTLASVADAARGDLDVTVYLVDDGSDEPVGAGDLPECSDTFRIMLARHACNLGQGASLETARRLALLDPPRDAYVTMDADGQHRVDDAFALARAVRDGADVAFGNRFLGDSNVPSVKRLVLCAARIFERALTGLRLSDAHNGLRGFSRRALERIPIRQSRMAHATEIKQRVSRAPELVIVERPVSVRYTRQSIQKGQSSLGALSIVHELATQYLFGEP
ncbi:MAG: glycosyltransferase family 2 protein, partial [Polyangiaceae bacterium]